MEILHSEIERILLNESINKSLMANLVQGVIRYKNHMYLLDKRETNLYDESNLLVYVFYDGRSLDEQSQEDLFNYLCEENQEILSQMKVLDENDYPIHLYLDFSINASQANYFIKNIRDKTEQEKYREIQEEIEILLTKASISSKKQLELLANIISNLK